MTTYGTSADFALRLGSVFESIYPGTPPSAAAGADLEAACAEINGALCYRYALPVEGEQSLALLKDWNLTLAEERAYARCAGSEFPEKLKLRVEQVRKALDALRTDAFRLPDAAERGAANGGGMSLAEVETPVFSRGKMRGF